MGRHAAWLLLGLALFSHLPALQGAEFHYDDGHSLVRNPHIRDLANLPRFFLDPSMFSENPSDAMYRPVVLVAHAVSQSLFPDSPAGFLALNLALHALATLLLYHILCCLLAKGRSLFGASLFALHPLQTEVVNYASARSESLAAVGILLVVFAFLRYRDSGSNIWLAALAGGQLFALGAKETGVVAPLLLLLIDRLMPGNRARTTRRAQLISTGLVAVYLLVYASFRTYSTGPGLRSSTAQLATQTKALLHYLRGIAVPVDLSVTPQFTESQSLLDAVVILAGAAIASGVLLLWQNRRRHPQLAVAAGWWLICLLPTLIVPLNVLVNDHRPYLAMGGMAMAAGVIGPRRLPGAGFLSGLVALILISLCWQRAFAWQTEITLWQNAVREGPSVAVAHHNLAFAYHQGGQMSLAQSHYEQAIALKPDYARPLTNLGALYRDAGRLDEAEAVLLRATRSEPGSVETLNNLGLVYAAQGRFDQAVRAYQAALQADAGISEVWYNLGLAQRDAGQTEDARRSLQRALQLDPGIHKRLGPSHR